MAAKDIASLAHAYFNYANSSFDCQKSNKNREM